MTRYAVSVITSVPTRTCPCSMNLMAAWTWSAILNLVITTGSLRRQKALTVTLCSTSESFPRPDVRVSTLPQIGRVVRTSAASA